METIGSQSYRPIRAIQSMIRCALMVTVSGIVIVIISACGASDQAQQDNTIDIDPELESVSAVADSQAAMPRREDLDTREPALSLGMSPVGAPAWQPGASNYFTTSEVTFGAHVFELYSSSYSGVVFSVSPVAGSGVSGPLMPSDSAFLRDDDGATHPLTTIQSWSTGLSVTVGSMTFGAITTTAESFQLVIPSIDKPDSTQITGPWVLDLGDNRAPITDGASVAYAAFVGISEPVTHTVVGGPTTVKFNEEGQNDFDTANPTPIPTVPIVTPVPSATAVAVATPDAVPTLQWAPNAMTDFTIRITSAGSPPHRHIYAALEPTTGIYWFDIDDIN